MIRRYSPSDLAGVKFLAYSEDNPSDAQLAYNGVKLLETASEGSTMAFVAEGSGLIVGFNVGFILPNKVLLPYAIYVDPEHRNQGIARALSETLENESGCEISMIYFRKGLSEHYENQGYVIGDFAVAIKQIAAN